MILEEELCHLTDFGTYYAHHGEMGDRNPPSVHAKFCFPGIAINNYASESF